MWAQSHTYMRVLNSLVSCAVRAGVCAACLLWCACVSGHSPGSEIPSNPGLAEEGSNHVRDVMVDAADVRGRPAAVLRAPRGVGANV